MKHSITLSLVLLLNLMYIMAQDFVLSTSPVKTAKLVTTAENVINKDYFRLGYCTEDVALSGLGLRNGGNIGAFIELTSASLAGFVGDSIYGVRVGFSFPLTNVTVSIRESLTGSNVQSKTINVTQGWNNVQFDKAVKIEIGKNYYLGYNVALPAAVYAISYSSSSVSSGAMLLQINGGNFDDYTTSYGALSLKGLIGGDESHFSNLAKIADVNVMPYIIRGSNVPDPNLNINNFGINEIKNLEIEFKYASKIPVKKIISISILPYTSAAVAFAGINFDVSGTVSFQITKINDLPYKSNIVEKHVTVYSKEDAVPRKTVLEQFTTEACVYCPGASAIIKDVISKSEYSDKVFWASHHAGFYTDPYTLSASTSYLRFYGSSGTYAPAMMMDRTIFASFGDVPVNSVGDAPNVTSYFNQALAIPAFVTVNIAQNNNLSGTVKSANITVSGSWKGELPTDNMYVNIFLIENNIPTTNQSGSPTSTYIHNNVIRDVLTGTDGRKITWNGNNYSVNVTSSVNSQWKIGDMKVLAFVSKNYLNSLNNVQVQNAEQAVLDATSGLNDTFSNISIRVKDRRVIVDGDFTRISVFDTKGVQLNNMNLNNGVYLVKIRNEKEETVRKFIVR